MMQAQTRRLPLHWIGSATLAMVAFAGNSLLCRLALRGGAIDVASFTAIRLLAGALTLALLTRCSRRGAAGSRNWGSALALFGYAAAFSWAYLSLAAGTGALLLFGAVQLTMISAGLWQGERLRPWQWTGFLAAASGLVALLLPGVHAPSWSGAGLMLLAGLCWGVYSLRGRRAGGDPLLVTAGNFWRAALLALLLSAALAGHAQLGRDGVIAALASGALASGLGYSIWYSALPQLSATAAASLQLTVPVLAALAAALLLGEPLTLRLVLAAVVVLGGVGLVIRRR